MKILCVGKTSGITSISKNKSDSGDVHYSNFAGLIARPAPHPLGTSLAKRRLPGTQGSKLKKSQLVFIQSIV